MRQRVVDLVRKVRLPNRPLILAVGAVVGFVSVVGVQLSPPDPESRLPGSQRLTALIARQQQENEAQKNVVADLRNELDQKRAAVSNQQAGLVDQNKVLKQAAITAGTVPVQGTGFTVTLDDSSLDSSPTGNVNDLVIHSQDVQAVVNAMWSAGAEAVAINGQRVISTSAILCVGNTLLLNGTVHAPPYEISGIGANRATFQDDVLVKRLRQDADRFSLRFSVSRESAMTLPGYTGPTKPLYAQVAQSQ